ncbi:olfactory receptor 1052-like [Rhinatrema bivittatum]|uniref:olfactory receptor 1052-like n=1 Tax=Rhinatrema bivittatum TaxID=194408 RepID=UPI00112A3A23|nr:olfactory receptor 1052-like [Rhinatrema bivittatum]
MARSNHTVSSFLLLGFTHDPQLQVLLFLLFLLVYSCTMLGNIGIVTIIKLDSHLQTPMYFFLSHLSFLDICYTSVISPKMLFNFLVEEKTISYTGCITQLYFYSALGSTECLLLAVMAYDRYVAICNPLLYTAIMTRGLCIRLAVAAYITGFAHSVIETGCIFRLSFCGPNVINNFACDFPPLFLLSCTDTSVNEFMLKSNHTVSSFLLLGFTHDPQLQVLLFLLFLLVYSCTMLGNIGIFTIIKLDSHLQTPMYFFLSHLSFLDICYSSVISPKMLFNFLVEEKTISYTGCITQLYFYSALASTECLLLAVMAYDRYVAICNPLLYTVIMTRGLCIRLALAAYITGFAHSVIETGCIFRLSFCGPNVINHFACDFPPLFLLSCTDTSVNEVVLFTFAGSVTMTAVTIIIFSYTHIIIAILKIRSAEGRRKAFSTCASHFVCVTLFYGTILIMYLRPSSSYSQEQDKILSLFYAVVIPMLNPLIYSLRNQEIKTALRKAICRKMFSHLSICCHVVCVYDHQR